MSEISKEKHSKKKSVPPSDSLFPSEKSPASFALRATSTADEMFPITGLSDAQLRQIQRQKNPAGAPWFPKPALSLWDTVATLRGWSAWRESRAAATTPRLETLSFPSMESCEGATGIPKTIQQTAKQKGCPAFRGPRVYLLPLIQWIFREAAAGQVADWGKLNTKLDAQLKQVNLDTQLNRLRKSDEMETCIRELCAAFFAMLKRLKLECPRDFEMRPKDYIKKGMDQKYTQTVATLSAAVEKYFNAATAPQPELTPIEK